MMDNLEDAYSRLSLTEEEAKEVVFEEGTPSEQAEEIALSLVSKLMTAGRFNARVMKNVLKNLWKPATGLLGRDMDSNLLVFQFFSPANRKFVLNEGPWAPSEFEFSTAHFWVEAYDVLGARQTKAFAEFLGSHVGTFVDCEDEQMFGADKAICFRADIDVWKPLRHGASVKMKDKTIWVRIKYVKVPTFCYGCGKLGHVLNSCNIVAKSELDLQYGAWLGASPLKTRRRNVEAKMEDEKRLFLALWGKGGNCAKQKQPICKAHDQSTSRG
ncbi:hypothetical protein Cgig2_015844 [Carnegiea gigantea]|uniref:CCHC-type domain-containing protein n=1 Tax=Carnegiea gigantea TaxID=171969 RepID=A0A9Q1KHC2_9CARY|nr:hypothetical protein Cgig2_015844 [Carnegiea gigantea]